MAENSLKPTEPQPTDETINLDSSGKPEDPKLWEVHKHWYSFTRRKKIASLFLLLVIAAVAAFFLWGGHQAGAPGADNSSVKVSDKVPSPLTGEMVAPALAKRTVTGVMIENAPEARPQSGIQDAGVVFEAIAEGGITRFLTLYQEAQPQYVGPVRSLRPYYIDWANGFDAPIAHVGGSPTALNRIRNGGKDLDQFFNGASYWRITSRASPHNVYTNFKNLDALNKAKGYTKSNFTGFPRKAAAPLTTPTASVINMGISGPLFNVRYAYNAKHNYYLRSEGGAKHYAQKTTNPKSLVQLHPNVVIALITQYGLRADQHHSEYETIGHGTAYIFQDGGFTKGTWNKTARGNQIRFNSAKGKAITLDPGQTWITALGAKSDLSFHK